MQFKILTLFKYIPNNKNLSSSRWAVGPDSIIPTWEIVTKKGVFSVHIKTEYLSYSCVSRERV